MPGGQLPAASAQLSGSSGITHPISLLLYNSDTVSETVTLQITPSGGTILTALQFALATGESALVSNVPISSGDVLSAFATNASKVNYFILPAALNGPLALTVYDVNGAFKSGVLTGASPTFANVLLTGLLTESGADALTAVGTSQGTGLALAKEVNRVTTAAASTAPFNGVQLPAAAASLTIMVINSAANPIQVYGAGTDTINDVLTTTGITQPPGSVFFYGCSTAGPAGKWYVEGIASGYSGSLSTLWVVSGITAAGGGQGGATALTAMVNRVTTCGAGNGVILPTNAVGLNITVTNDGANACNVYPDTGAAINSLGTNNPTPLPVGATATFFCEAANVWRTLPVPPREVVGTLTTNGAGTILAATIVGGEVTRTGLTAAVTDTTDTAAAIITAVHGAAIGQSWEFTYVNNTAFTVTVAGGNNVTVTEQGSGTLTVPQNSWARFLVTVVSATTVTMTGIANGPNSVLQPAKFTTINVTTGTLAAGNASGAAFTSLTSTNATPGNQAMRTVAQVLADTPGLAVGMSYMLRITQTGTGTLTLTTDGSAQFTMTGTMTVPQNTFRDFIVTINTATTGTVQAVGTGTFS